MKRVLSSLLVLALVAPVAADPRTVQVLKTQGKIDAATRAKIDAAILDHAKTDASASAGDITFAEAAAALGCKPEATACRDEVREMLAVDEVVYATATKKPGGIDVTVYRITKGGTAREMQTTVASGQPVDKLDGVAPLFGAAQPAPAPPPAPPPDPAPAPVKPAVTAAPRPAREPAKKDIEVGVLEASAPEPTEPAAASPSPTPGQPMVDAPVHPHRRLQLAGMVAGGAMVFVGFLSWGQALDLQGQIDDAPTSTSADLVALRDLEKRADGAAGLGNALFLGGAVLGGISTYYYVKGRRRARAQAMATRITPAVFADGAGIAIGGSL